MEPDAHNLWLERCRGNGDVTLEVNGGAQVKAHWSILSTVPFFAEKQAEAEMQGPWLLRLNDTPIRLDTLELILEQIYKQRCFTNTSRDVPIFAEMVHKPSLQRDAIKTLYRNPDAIEADPYNAYLLGVRYDLESIWRRAWCHVLSTHDCQNLGLMLTSGVDINTIINHSGQTALHWLVDSKADINLIQYFLQSGADINVIDIKGRSILGLATWHGNSDVVKVALKLAPQYLETKDQWGQTPLHKACSRGDAQIAEILLDAGADTVVTCKQGYTALHLAAIAGHKEVVSLLLSRGVEIQQADEQFQQTALYMSALKGHVDLVQFLLSFSIELDDEVSRGNSTPLHVAAEKGHEDVVKVLLDHGANPQRDDWRGRTPLHNASATGNRMCVQLLIEAGADIRAQDKSGRTALHLSSAFNNINTTRELIKYKTCPLNIADHTGCTALHYATGNDSKDLILALKGAGAIYADFDTFGRLMKTTTVLRSPSDLYSRAIAVRY